MHLVLEQALERDTVPLPECQRGQDLGNWGLGDLMGRPLPASPHWCGAGNGGWLAGRRWIGSPVKTSGLPPF